MNTYQLIAWLRYRNVAKGRHGVHSPAVYRFIEEGLRPPSRRFEQLPPYTGEDGNAWHPSLLMRRIAHHFRVEEVRVPAAAGIQVFHRPQQRDDETSGKAYRRLHDWREIPATQWSALPDRYAGEIGTDDIIAVGGMHRSAAGSAAWQALYSRPDVRLSIDLFGTGLLFFAPDFKERQHFVLRYPL